MTNINYNEIQIKFIPFQNGHLRERVYGTGAEQPQHAVGEEKGEGQEQVVLASQVSPFDHEQSTIFYFTAQV